MNDENRFWELLERGGMRASGDPRSRGNYDGTRDPAGVEELGSSLAQALRSYEPTVVMVRHGVPDAVLAHVVARELGANIVIAFDADGLVAHAGILEPGARVVVLTDALDHPAGLEAMATYARQCGADVRAVALLARPAGDVLDGVPTVGLVELPEEEAGTAAQELRTS